MREWSKRAPRRSDDGERKKRVRGEPRLFRTRIVAYIGDSGQTSDREITPVRRSTRSKPPPRQTPPAPFRECFQGGGLSSALSARSLRERGRKKNRGERQAFVTVIIATTAEYWDDSSLAPLLLLLVCRFSNLVLKWVFSIFPRFHTTIKPRLRDAEILFLYALGAKFIGAQQRAPFLQARVSHAHLKRKKKSNSLLRFHESFS